MTTESSSTASTNTCSLSSQTGKLPSSTTPMLAKYRRSGFVGYGSKNTGTCHLCDGCVSLRDGKGLPGCPIQLS